MADFNSYDFMVTEENNVMLLLYARESEPFEPAVILYPEENKIELFRNGEDILTLEEIEAEIFNNLEEEETLLVCELAPTDNEEENEIIYTYEAQIVRQTEE